VAERELEAGVRSTMRRFLYAASGDVTEPLDFWQKPKTAKFLDGLPDPGILPPWLTEADLDYFTREFERSGFRGGLNWYRNFDRNWRLTPALAGATVKQPALFIAGERDGVLAMVPVDAMKPLVPDLRRILLIPHCGHWTQQERPSDVNAALVEFLLSL
jgi:pimeloyl-ACP methyl ester carboxylesterase